MHLIYKTQLEMLLLNESFPLQNIMVTFIFSFLRLLDGPEDSDPDDDFMNFLNEGVNEGVNE